MSKYDGVSKGTGRPIENIEPKTEYSGSAIFSEDTTEELQNSYTSSTRFFEVD
ncbi:hypothetical protein K3495_g3572 [Podosphaera aphanis]|nr:hypothetical protein K3495_g3572 [Podosphaera aphanis]